MNRLLTISFISAAIAATSAIAVKPQAWLHQDEQSFTSTDRKNTTVDSHGDVKLARQIEILMSSEDAPVVLSAVSLGSDGKTVYAGSGTDGAVYQISGKKTEKVATIPATIVTSLVPLSGNSILVGGGGDGAGLYGITKNKVKKLFSHDDVKYIWDIIVARNGIYVATGPKAKIYQLDSEFNGKEIYSAEPLAKNILCLAEGKNGLIYAGTDEKGLVLELNPRKNSGRVILDAPEKEISTIIYDGRDGLFVSTSDASKANGGDAPSGTKDGKPAAPAPKIKTPAPKSKPAAKPAPKTEIKPATRPAENKGDQKPKKKGKPEDKPKKKKDAKKKPEKKSNPAVSDKPQEGSPVSANSTLALKVENSATGNNAKTAPKPAVTVTTVKTTRTTVTRPPNGGKTTSPSKSGNAIYHIDARGMVHAIFRKPVLIQSMIARDDRLVIATGNEGRIYFVTTDGELSGEMIDTDAGQITDLAPGRGKDILFVTANKGSVGRISTGYAKNGTITSQPLNAEHMAQWGTIQLDGETPPGSTLTISTRSGNLEKADDNTWSDWSKEMPLQDGFIQIGSPSARFLQYRITMTSNGRVTPVLNRAQLIYQAMNMPPAISGIDVTATGEDPKRKTSAPSKVFRIVTIKAADPNSDGMKFKLEYQFEGSSRWILLNDSLTSPKYIWDTRSIADGKCTLRVTVNDTPSNPADSALTASRLSEPITIDRTPPEIKGLSCIARGRNVTVRGKIFDKLSRITSIHYKLNDSEEWHAVLPSDSICDSNRESFKFVIKDMKNGPHRVMLRAEDELGNKAYGGCDTGVK